MKYHSRKCVLDGITFDSVRESKRYAELKLMESAGEISCLQRQVKFILIPAQREEPIIGKRGGIKPGKVIEKECSYVADFVYIDADGHQVVEDSKGFRTADYKIKRKLMLSVYGIRIKET